MITRVVVTGRVQGVGFRWFVRQEARRLGVAGWVRNLPDGSVELAAGGAAPAVQRLLDHVRVGPDASQVEAVTTDELEVTEPLPYPFTVLK